MLFSLRYHIIPYSLYFFNLPFYPLSEKRCTFAAQFMKDRKKEIWLYKNMIRGSKGLLLYFILWARMRE